MIEISKGIISEKKTLIVYGTVTFFTTFFKTHNIIMVALCTQRGASLSSFTCNDNYGTLGLQ